MTYAQYETHEFCIGRQMSKETNKNANTNIDKNKKKETGIKMKPTCPGIFGQ